MLDFFTSVLVAIVAVFVFLTLIAIIGLILAWPILFIWNWLMPAVFGLSVITYWQAFWMYFLAGLLTKGGGVSTSSDS